MKNLLIVLSLLPTLSFASSYSCSGAKFSIDVADGPAEMRVKGNGFDTTAQNVRISSAFDTVVTGNIVKPATTVKLTIKDIAGDSAGESFKGSFQVSSATGVRNYKEIICIRGDN